MPNLLSVQTHDHVARLTLDSPGNHNALSAEMIETLSRALDDIANSDARVVILAAQGRAFCAGHDLREMRTMREGPQPERDLTHLFDRCAALMTRITRQPQPVIAQVQGVATAAGCQLVASCDLAVAAQDVRFGVNGISIGLFCATPAVALSRAIPARAAFELLTTGDFISATRALELGLVNRVVAPQDLAEETFDLAGRIASKDPVAIRMGKAAFRAQLNRPLTDAYHSASRTMTQNMMEPATAEGIAAFLEKRSPRGS